MLAGGLSYCTRPHHPCHELGQQEQWPSCIEYGGLAHRNKPTSKQKSKIDNGRDDRAGSTRPHGRAVLSLIYNRRDATVGFVRPPGCAVLSLSRI
jgi:hypothetical protein